MADPATLEWRIRCDADDCGFALTVTDEATARSLARMKPDHGVTVVESRTVVYGEWERNDD